MELSESDLGAYDLTVFAAEREKRRFNVRSLLVRRIIEEDIGGDAVPAESEALLTALMGPS